jgi:hypothetical protein
MISDIVTMLGVVIGPTAAGVKGYFNLRERLLKLETRDTASDKLSDVEKQLVLSKLDAISEKIDLRCDSLEQRVGRIERSLNGHLKHD